LKVESGKLKVESGKWKVESGKNNPRHCEESVDDAAIQKKG